MIQAVHTYFVLWSVRKSAFSVVAEGKVVSNWSIATYCVGVRTTVTFWYHAKTLEQDGLLLIGVFQSEILYQVQYNPILFNWLISDTNI